MTMSTPEIDIAAARRFADSAEQLMNAVSVQIATLTMLTTYTPAEIETISVAIIAKVREEIARFERDALDSLGNGLSIARKRSDDDPQSHRRTDSEQQ